MKEREGEEGREGTLRKRYNVAEEIKQRVMREVVGKRGRRERKQRRDDERLKTQTRQNFPYRLLYKCGNIAFHGDICARFSRCHTTVTRISNRIWKLRSHTGGNEKN